jgi:hypothetical protein
MVSNIFINITGYINNKIDLGLWNVTKRWTNSQELQKHDMEISCRVSEVSCVRTIEKCFQEQTVQVEIKLVSNICDFIYNICNFSFL